jgi:nucleotide-binding universal stress UspA family protein
MNTASSERADGVGGPIVVGVDGSDGSKLALRWAVQEARWRGAKVVAVGAWEYPYIYAGPADMVPLTPWKEQGPEVLQMLNAEIAAVLAEESPVEVEARVEEGPAARVLLDAAEGAALLVVGSRGRGGFRGLLLGSVSMQCAHHASCPVVIIPTGAS